MSLPPPLPLGTCLQLVSPSHLLVDKWEERTSSDVDRQTRIQTTHRDRQTTGVASNSGSRWNIHEHGR